MSNIFLLLRSQALHFNIHSKEYPNPKQFLDSFEKIFQQETKHQEIQRNESLFSPCSINSPYYFNANRSLCCFDKQ